MFKNSYKGKFITFEGIDGCGKSTQIKLLGDFLKFKKVNFISTYEPTDLSMYGKKIRKIIEGKIQVPKNPSNMQKLFVLDRKMHLNNKIIPELKRGKLVISDRYFLSTFAYGMAQGLTFKKILSLHKKTLGQNFILPNLIFILDLNPKIALLRIKKSKKRKNIDYFEKLEKLKIIRKNYLFLAKKFPNIILLKRTSIQKDFARIKKILQEKMII